MPRFFFHVADSVLVPDEEGTELADLAAARVEAVTVAGAMLRDHAPEFWNSGEWKVIVTDEDRLILFSICCQALAAPWPPVMFAPRRRAPLPTLLQTNLVERHTRYDGAD